MLNIEGKKKGSFHIVRKLLFFRLLGQLSLLFLLTTTCNSNERQTRLLIATAANMQFAMEALVEQFEEKYDIKCDLVTSSSGKLTAQIKEGAPFDLFVSANMKYPTAIYESGFAVEPPKVYAHGKLVLWTMFEDITPSLDLLSDPKIKHIAIANPKTAPYGMASEVLLQQQGLLELLTPKLVYGESISQSNQFIVTQSVEVGFTAMSIVLASKMRKKGNWVAVDRNLYPPIEQGVVLLNNQPATTENASLFHQFLFTEEAQQLLKDYGYEIP